jgi:transcription elongation factor/antiterminator RfaH
MPVETSNANGNTLLAPQPRSDRWYVVYTLPHREAAAQLHLRNQGFRTFLPSLSKTIRHARRHDTVLAPLFPRYLFVAFDLRRDRWRAINGTRGVTTLIMQDDRPAPVQTGIIETLIASSSATGEVLFHGHMAPGDRVQLIAGPFAGQLGILERLNGAGRVQVLLEIMGSHVPIKLHARSLVPIAQPCALKQQQASKALS